MKNKKIAALLSIALLISLTGCGGNSAGNDVPPSNSIESSQAPIGTPETPTEPTESTSQTQDPPQSEEPTIKPAQEPTTAQTEEPKEQVTPSKAPTPEPTQEPTTPPATSTPAPVHTHSYSSSVTKQATCGTNGIITYTCSCGDTYTEAIKATGNHNYNSTITKQATCAEEGTMSYACAICGATYTEAIPANGNHQWATRHVDGYGYYEKGETHEVLIKKCGCGYQINSDMPNWVDIWESHTIECGARYSFWTEQVPNGEPKWIEVVPAHDETYCTICGATK